MVVHDARLIRVGVIGERVHLALDQPAGVDEQRHLVRLVGEVAGEDLDEEPVCDRDPR